MNPEIDFMQMAIDFSKESKLTPGRNHPKVGVVLTVGNKDVVKACKDGSSHAEYLAVKKAQEDEIDLHGATAYVTLEPCSHRNHCDKIPCAAHLVKAGVKKVVIAMLDNNPDIKGLAVEWLLRQGVWVVLAPEKYRKQVAELNKDFLQKVRNPEETTLDSRLE